MVIIYFIHAFKNTQPIFLRILYTLGKILILYVCIFDKVTYTMLLNKNNINMIRYDIESYLYLCIPLYTPAS